MAGVIGYINTLASLTLAMDSSPVFNSHCSLLVTIFGENGTAIIAVYNHVGTICSSAFSLLCVPESLRAFATPALQQQPLFTMETCIVHLLASPEHPSQPSKFAICTQIGYTWLAGDDNVHAADVHMSAQQ